MSKKPIVEKHVTSVNEEIWAPGDTYLTVKVQVNPPFKKGDYVEVTVKKVRKPGYAWTRKPKNKNQLELIKGKQGG